ncbi:hypothetical protein GCM10009682_17920 [Luedemannella flava]|uniref:Uncharacterized protein n=1 Tax=Luedemannella flava TaxID=349316 RepID=A0ABN2LQC6_9ACTN
MAVLVLIVAVAVPVAIGAWGGPGSGPKAGPGRTSAPVTTAVPSRDPVATGTGAAGGGDASPVPVGNAVPAVLLGTWAGDLHQENIDRTYPATVTLTGGRVGAVVGTVDYPAPGCSGQLRLTSVSGTEIRVTETITKGSDCLSPIPLRLSVPAPGDLRYRAGTDGGSNPPVTGALSRVADQLPAALAGTWQGAVRATGADDDVDIVVVLTGRSLGRAGTIEYVAKGCRATLTADQATAGAGWFTEAAGCAGAGLVSLTLTGTDTVRFRWLDPDAVDGAAMTGTLSRR